MLDPESQPHFLRSVSLRAIRMVSLTINLNTFRPFLAQLENVINQNHSCGELITLLKVRTKHFENVKPKNFWRIMLIKTLKDILKKKSHTSHCDEKPGSFCIINQMFDIFSKNYLTTNNPYRKRIHKIRILYCPDPEFRKFENIFFS